MACLPRSGDSIVQSTSRRGVSFERQLGRELGRHFVKSAVVTGAPFSSLTARADFIANKKYKPEAPNPLTSEEQATLDRLLAGMSKSRARVVGAHRGGRKSIQALLQSTGLWD